jgi:ribonuclease HI
MTKIIAYCDGAYSPARKTSGAGVVIIKDDQVILKFAKKFNGGTNNTAELCAAILAMSSIRKPIDEFQMFTDSMYIIGTVNDGWNTKTNKKLWKRFNECYNHLKLLCPNITFTWVKGHDKDIYNILADKLANNASTSWNID